MDIYLQLYDVSDLDAIQAASTKDEPDAATSRPYNSSQIAIEWQGPIVRSGFWEGFVEWIGRIDASSIPGATLANVLGTYLWDLILRGRGQHPSVDRHPREVGARPNVSFAKAPMVKVVVTKSSKRIEFDPVTIDREIMMMLITKLLNDDNAPR